MKYGVSMLRSITRILLICAGWISVVLAIFGIFLPLLPTTPFLLLAAVCFGKSSPRFYHWLVTNRWFGDYLSRYRAGQGMQMKHKVVALGMMWPAMLYSAFGVLESPYGQISLMFIAIAVTWHLCRLPTYSPENVTSVSKTTTLPDSGD